MTNLKSCQGKGVITRTNEEDKRAIEQHERKYHGRDRRTSPEEVKRIRDET